MSREPRRVGALGTVITVLLILALIVVVLVKKTDTEIFKMLIFVLAAVENFIGATISFSESKRVRGNVYAIVCAIFLIIALILAMSYFVFV